MGANFLHLGRAQKKNAQEMGIPCKKKIKKNKNKKKFAERLGIEESEVLKHDFVEVLSDLLISDLDDSCVRELLYITKTAFPKETLGRILENNSGSLMFEIVKNNNNINNNNNNNDSLFFFELFFFLN